jgi:hypothetical protein
LARLILPKLKRHLYVVADILRSKMEAARYKDYISGMLFLKRFSDVFEEERERIIKEDMAAGAAREEAEQEAQKRDSYSTIFVPEKARFAYPRDQVHGDALNKALGSLDEQSPILNGILDYIDHNAKIGQKPMSENLSRQGAGRLKLNQANRASIPVVVPPEEEQNAIRDALASLEAQSLAERQECEKLTRLKVGLLNDLLTGRVPIARPEAAP